MRAGKLPRKWLRLKRGNGTFAGSFCVRRTCNLKSRHTGGLNISLHTRGRGIEGKGARGKKKAYASFLPYDSSQQIRLSQCHFVMSSPIAAALRSHTHGTGNVCRPGARLGSISSFPSLCCQICPTSPVWCAWHSPVPPSLPGQSLGKVPPPSTPPLSLWEIRVGRTVLRRQRC